MVVIVDNGAVVKKFTNYANALGYAESMMRKRHDVWVLSIRAAYLADLI